MLFVLLFIGISAQSLAADWPQQLTADSGAVLVIYQPQVEEFTGNSLEARAAVSVKETPDAAPVFGAIWIKARIDTNRDTRTAVLRSLEVSDVRFADASEENKEKLAQWIESEVSGSSFAFSVDQLLADLDQSQVSEVEADLKHDAPKIMLSKEPALLVSIDGDPVFKEIEGSSYERVVNTPFLIVKDGRKFYLYIGSNAWYEGLDVTGPWEYVANVPSDIAGLVEPAEENSDSVDNTNLKIIVATEPTELIVSDGDPSWTPIEGMNLLYMDNTDSSVFLELESQQYYIMMSGRWFRGGGLPGEITWEHVPNDELPKPFSDIPEDSPSGDVLSQVAGTQQARDAVLDNTIPQTAAINRDDTSFSVKYDGDPDFAPIEDIGVEYAQNTSQSVFKYGNQYFGCKDGVWYVSNSPNGPWAVATEIPEAIYNIPTSNPHHNVTYVKVYDVTPEVVYVGYTPGYYGSYYYSGTVIYGSGWYYNPWYGPWYYPRYPTWGFHVRYNPRYGWSFGISWTNGPFRFTFGTGGAWWGVGGFRPYPRPYVRGGYRKTNINVNINNNINIGRGDRPGTRPNIYDRPENRARNAERPATADRRARPADGVQNDVLTDRAGDVYRKDADGNWNRRDSNGNWSKADNLDRPAAGNRPSTQPATQPSTRDYQRPSQTPSTRPSTQPSYSRPSNTATRPQLERDYSSRQHGAARTNNYQHRSRPARRR